MPLSITQIHCDGGGPQSLYAARVRVLPHELSDSLNS
jgi:hypothetical protein